MSRYNSVITINYPWRRDLVTVFRAAGWMSQPRAANGQFASIEGRVTETGAVKLNVSKEQIAKIRANGGEAWADFKAKAEKARSSAGSQMTPEFWQATNELKDIKKARKQGLDFLFDDPDGQQAEAEARMIEQFELSAAAQKAGYNPAKMSKDDWLDFADKAKEKAYDKLAFATQEGRTLETGKLRGSKKEWMLVGGQHIKGHSSAISEKKARAMVQDAFVLHREDAEAHMTGKLREIGYGKEELNGLSYAQRRHLLAEVGLGRPDPKWGISGGQIGAQRRREIIRQAGPATRRAATNIAANPHTAEGLTAWDTYMMASIQGGNHYPEMPHDSVYTPPDQVPRYVAGYDFERSRQRRQSQTLSTGELITEEEIPF